jgi:hypothetical protein
MGINNPEPARKHFRATGGSGGGALVKRSIVELGSQSVNELFRAVSALAEDHDDPELLSNLRNAIAQTQTRCPYRTSQADRLRLLGARSWLKPKHGYLDNFALRCFSRSLFPTCQFPVKSYDGSKRWV